MDHESLAGLITGLSSVLASVRSILSDPHLQDDQDQHLLHHCEQFVFPVTQLQGSDRSALIRNAEVLRNLLALLTEVQEFVFRKKGDTYIFAVIAYHRKLDDVRHLFVLEVWS